MIGIVDYGVGNLRSIEKAINKVGYSSKICRNTNDLENIKAIVFPGVGAFRNAVENLKSLWEKLKYLINTGVPLLGICIGMHILLDFGEEDNYPGLSLIPGIAKKLPIKKVPHMGWNKVIPNRCKLLDVPTYFYFAHTYYCNVDQKFVTATVEYDRFEFPAIIEKENITGVQFHPEKSGSCGLDFLKRWLNEVL